MFKRRVVILVYICVLVVKPCFGQKRMQLKSSANKSEFSYSNGQIGINVEGTSRDEAGDITSESETTINPGPQLNSENKNPEGLKEDLQKSLNSRSEQEER